MVRVAEARAPHVPHRAAAIALGLGNVELVAVMVFDDFTVRSVIRHFGVVLGRYHTPTPRKEECHSPLFIRRTSPTRIYIRLPWECG